MFHINTITKHDIFTPSLNPKLIIFHSTLAGSVFHGTGTRSKLSTYAQATTNHMHHVV